MRVKVRYVYETTWKMVSTNRAGTVATAAFSLSATSSAFGFNSLPQAPNYAGPGPACGRQVWDDDASLRHIMRGWMDAEEDLWTTRVSF